MRRLTVKLMFEAKFWLVVAAVLALCGTSASVANTGLFSIAWDDTETGILDDVYVYRVAGDFAVGGEVWNQAWSHNRDHTLLDGDHVVTMACGDTNTVTLPELAGCWNGLTSAGREIVVENRGPEICIVTTPLSDDALNAVLGGDTLHLGAFETATLRAVTSSHWAVPR